jgi:multicomponent Na+:H+ antiporter subunit G
MNFSWMELLASVLILFGSALMFLAAVGLWRLPDALCRAHALAKSSCLGVLLLLIAAALVLYDHGWGILLILLFTGIFQFVTIPISAHLFGRLAFRKQVPLWKSREASKEL